MVDSVSSHHKSGSVSFFLLWSEASHKLSVSDVFSAASWHVAAFDEFNCVGSFDLSAYTVGKTPKFIR